MTKAVRKPQCDNMNSSSQSDSIPHPSSAVSVGPHRRVRRRPFQHTVETDQSKSPTLEAALLAATSAVGDADRVRADFRKLTIEFMKAIGACHVIRSADGHWHTERKNSNGRIPAATEFREQLGQTCINALARSSIQIQSLNTISNAQAMVAPVGGPGARQEVFLVVIPKTAKTGLALMQLEKIANAFRLWCRANATTSVQWKLHSLSAIIELVSEIENCQTVDAACSLVANELSRQVGCVIAISGGRSKRRLKAISEASKLSRSSRHVRMFQQALNECLVRNEPGCWPARSEHEDVLLLAHQQLAASAQVDCVRSFPLTTPGENTVGAIVLAGSESVVGTDRCQQFLKATAPRIANALATVKRAQRSLIGRMLAAIPRRLAKFRTILFFAIFAGIIGLMFVPMNYRVRCSCIVEPVQRRYAVAPFDGLIERGFVKPGDRVAANQRLATMDGRNVRWELAGVYAQRRQAAKEHEIELAKRDVSKAMLAQLEDERLAARQSILEFQQENLTVVSPIQGVVLSGSSERSEAASVKTGDVLFEIAPLSPLKIEVEIPAEELAQVEQDMPVTVWIDGQERTPLQGTLTRIYPRSELRNAANVFVAEFEFDNATGRMRPGMKGMARIDGRKRPLGWNLFHKPYDFVSSRLGHWW
jgi:biotin carboxyl carrier protein